MLVLALQAIYWWRLYARSEDLDLVLRRDFCWCCCNRLRSDGPSDILLSPFWDEVRWNEMTWMMVEMSRLRLVLPRPLLSAGCLQSPGFAGRPACTGALQLLSRTRLAAFCSPAAAAAACLLLFPLCSTLSFFSFIKFKEFDMFILFCFILY